MVVGHLALEKAAFNFLHAPYASLVSVGHGILANGQTLLLLLMNPIAMPLCQADKPCPAFWCPGFWPAGEICLQ